MFKKGDKVVFLGGGRYGSPLLNTKYKGQTLTIQKNYGATHPYLWYVEDCYYVFDEKVLQLVGADVKKEAKKEVKPKEQKAHKFAVGDFVKIISGDLPADIKPIQAGGRFHRHMPEIGKNFYITKLRNIYNGEGFGYKLGDAEWTWDERMLKRLRKAKPRIPAPVVEEEKNKADKPEKKAVPAPVVKEPLIAENNPYLLHKDLIEAFRKESNNHTKLGTCSYSVKHDVGVYFHQATDVCHARLGGYKAGQRVALILSITAHYKNMIPELKKAYLNYANYIMLLSPWKNCFHNRGIDFTLKNGVLMNCARPIEELAGAAVALRMGSEFGDRLHLFQRMLDEGYSGNVAWIMCYCVSKDYKFVGFDDAHRCINGGGELSELVSFFQNGYTLTKELRPYNKSIGMYNGISRWIVGNSYGRNIKQPINEWLRKKFGLPHYNGGWNAKVDIDKEVFFKVADEFEFIFNRVEK